MNPVIAMVAGEASGDTLGADLMVSLKNRYPSAKFIGIGGEKMKAEGFESWYPMESLSVMGFFEVLKHLFSLLKLRKSLIQRLIEAQPDVFIGIDAPDFNFKIEETLKAKGIPALHYVGPSVWAWREKRLNKIKRQVDGVLVLFPFEPPLYDKYGIPNRFVGHPVANQVPEFPDSLRARAQLGIEQTLPITGILPGSRMSEIEQMSDTYIQAAVKLAEIYPKMVFVIPCVHQKAKDRIQQSIDQYGKNNRFYLFDRQAPLVMEASDQLLVTSGTATLEAALMQRPMVVAIKVHPISYWLMKRLATTKWIGLPNILAQCEIVPEYIQAEATPEKLSLAMAKLISDEKLRQRQLTAFRAQYKALKQDASELAADAIETWAGLKRGQPSN